MPMTRSYGTKPPKREKPAPEPDRVVTSLVSVGQEPTRLGIALSRSQVTIHNPGIEPIYLGGRSCSARTSLPVQPGGYASLDIGAEIVLYAVTSTPEPVEIRVLEVA
jgi:hypothetical protein